MEGQGEKGNLQEGEDENDIDLNEICQGSKQATTYMEE